MILSGLLTYPIAILILTAKGNAKEWQKNQSRLNTISAQDPFYQRLYHEFLGE